MVNRDGKDILVFPKPKIIYLFEDGNAPDCHELNRLGLIVLIPFQLLRLRKAIEKERTPGNLEALKKLVTHDILGSIRKNIAIGNLTPMEGEALKRITWKLYRYLYEKYEELGKAGIHEMVEEAMILDLDYIVADHKKEIQEIIRKKDVVIQEKDGMIQEKDEIIEQMAKKLRELGMTQEEIEAMIK